MKQNKVPKNEYIRKPVGKTNPYKHDVDYVSAMGYRDDSPFNDRPYIDIHTPSGMIDMSNTGIPLMANGMYLPPYSGMHQFEPGIVREQKIPMAQDGWESRINNYLGNPLGRAQQMSTTNGKENDALRHAYASMYSSENAGPFIANALGLGHEIMGQPNSMKEHAGDIYNNFVGSMVGALPFVSTSNKEKAIKKLHKLGLLSSGTKAYGGGLLNKTLTCPSCGWSWKAVDGGKDIATCHKCGGTAKLAYGGDPSLPNIEGHYPFGGQNTKTHTHMKEGGWLDQYQTRGEVKPIYVTDSNDYRLRAYNDSLSAYNKNENYYKGYKPYTQKIAKEHSGIPYKPNMVYKQVSPTEHNIEHRKVVKKPVQPYNYKEPEEVITADYLPMIQASMPEMISREPEIIASPTPRPSSTNNRISWRMDPDTRKMVPVYLEGRTQKVKEGKRLYNKDIPSSTAAIPADFVPQFEPDQSKDVVSKKMGGWLDQYQDGGWDENFQRPGPVADNVAPVISTPFTPKISQEFLQQNVKPYSYNPLPIRTFEDFKGKRSTLGADYNDYLDYKKYIDHYKESNLPEILQDAEDSYQGRGKWEDEVTSNAFIQHPKVSNWLKLSHLDEAYTNKTRENQYYIPSGKQIKLTQGRYNLGKIDTGLVDEIVKKAKQYGVDPLDILSIAGRESTFAQPYGKKSKRNSNDLTDIFSAWANRKENASRYTDYFGKKKHPGLSLVKDKSGWWYREDHTHGESLAKYSQEDVDEYLKYLQEREKTGSKDNALDFVAKMIKDKKLHKYNPGDPDYQNKLANEKKLLSQEKELMKYLGSNNEESLTTKKMGGWLDKYQGDISGSQVMPSETTQSFIPANLKNKLDQLKKQDPKYKQKLAQEKKFYDDVAKAEEDARKKEIADRKARIANSIKAQDEKIIGNPNWREVLARQTQATGDKLRISDEPNFFDDYVNPAAMIGSMATGLGQAPYQAQQQDSYMPYLTGIGMPLAMGALAGLGAKSTGQFINNIVNPLAGLEQSLLNRGKGVIGKKPGFLTTQEELAMMNADDLPSGVSTPAQGNQLPPPPSEIIISPSGESRTVWQQIPIPDDPPITSLANTNPGTYSAMRDRLIQRMERPRNYSSRQENISTRLAQGEEYVNLADDYANMMAGRPAQNYPHMDLAQNRLRQDALFEERNRLLNEITTGDPDLSSFVSRTVPGAAPQVKTKIKNISGLTQEDALAIAAGKDKDKIAKMSETEFENTVLNPNGEIITYKKGPDVNNITYDMNTGRMVLRDQNIIPEEEYVNMFNTNLDRLNEIIAKKNKSGVQYRVKGLNREGHLTFETPEQLIPRQRTEAALDNYNAFQEHPEIWAEERAGLRQNETGSWQFNEEVGMDAYSSKEAAMKALSEAVEDQLGPMKKISGESVWGVNMNPGKWQGDVQDIANKEYYRAIPGLEMSNTTGSVFADKTARRGSKAYEAINDYLKEMGMGRVKPGFNSQTQFSKGAWEDFVKKGKAFGYYGDPKTVYGSMKSMLPYLGLGYLGYEGMQDDGYRRGGSLYTPPNLKKKSKSKGTSKNIQSSINSLFARNFDLYGSSNKAMYNPNSKYKFGGGWLDNLD